MTCSATTALGQETRQPPGNARLLDHRGRSVRAVDEDAFRRGPLPRSPLRLDSIPTLQWVCLQPARRGWLVRASRLRSLQSHWDVLRLCWLGKPGRQWRSSHFAAGGGRYRLRRHSEGVEAWQGGRQTEDHSMRSTHGTVQLFWCQVAVDINGHAYAECRLAGPRSTVNTDCSCKEGHFQPLARESHIRWRYAGHRHHGNALDIGVPSSWLGYGLSPQARCKDEADLNRPFDLLLERPKPSTMKPIAWHPSHKRCSHRLAATGGRLQTESGRSTPAVSATAVPVSGR
jgi:hypothetical protein